MYKYTFLIEGQGTLSDDFLWRNTGSSKIYKNASLLYKIPTKNTKDYCNKLDFLLDVGGLKNVGALPIEKIKTNQDRFGFKMEYLPNTMTLWEGLRDNKISYKEFISIMVIASDNLKKINDEKIKFSDLHHNNILINKDTLYPYYIDFDDAVIGHYTSSHISCMSHSLHDLKNGSSVYRDRLIREGNLDRENLFIMFLNCILKTEIENKNFFEFQQFLDDLANWFPDYFVKIISELKRDSSKEIIPFKYYLGDYLKREEIKNKCLKIGGLHE